MPPTTYRKVELHRARDLALAGTTPARASGLKRVRRGVYADAAQWQALPPWERYRARVAAVALTWTEPVFCLESAASILGLPVYGEPRDIHLLDPGGKSRRVGDVLVHGAAEVPQLTQVDGLTATAILPTTVALCRVLPPAFALGIADATLRRLGEPIDFASRGREVADRRGRRRLAWIQENASPVPESVGESVSRAVISWLGFDAPGLQVEFRHEGYTDRVDFFWRHVRVIGESDGYGKYDADDPDGVKAHFVAEKIREDRLRRHAGGFCRWDWADTMKATPLGDKLSAAGLVPVRPRQLALLETLRSNPRSLVAPPKPPGDAETTR